MRPSRLSSKAAPVVGCCIKTNLYSTEALFEYMFNRESKEGAVRDAAGEAMEGRAGKGRANGR